MVFVESVISIVLSWCCHCHYYTIARIIDMIIITGVLVLRKKYM